MAVLATATTMAMATISIATVSIAADVKAETVRLVVDYGDGAQVHLTALPWRDGMTVLDALAAAKKHPHGITFAQRGSGASSLVTQIGDLKNEGDGKNWLYTVNGKLAPVGAGAYKLKAGDGILWEFKDYEYN
jgi:ABC-type transport system substrate-binding protein